MDGTTKHVAFGLCMVIALIGTLAGGALAAINPEGYLGTVIGKDAENDLFEVRTTHEWVNIGWQPNSTLSH